ncbi:MAG: PucR family transcriptional regulator ligand-binding domain-containing protein, partial [Anaerolineales bacterium]|nr:PucR family transcriptional regulator ligand-binding domain-containing protein [Anaerolineales bacterium]
MLTLRQALQLSVFEKARVVAGAAGLEGVIRRVHVVDSPDAEYHLYGAGLLLFTSGYNLKDNPAEQARFIPQLVEHGLVGVVFSLGWSFADVPASMRQAADAHGFPLIAVPQDVKFITLVERLYVELVNEQFALKER